MLTEILDFKGFRKLTTFGVI